MKLTCHGAAQSTTGSRHLLEVDGSRLLLDCGLFEGRREESYQKNKNFPFAPADISATILSHAHVDHSGNLPTLCLRGFQGNIYSTFATRDLCAIMLQDSAKVQASDIAFVNKRRARHGLPPFQMLYNAEAADNAMKQFIALNYRRSFPVTSDVQATFLDAGHMLGSAQVVLDVKENGSATRLVYSGDVGRGHNDILRDPEPVDNVDILMIESTYGGRLHEGVETAKQEICRIVNETVARGGKLIIPSFAVGRTQQVVYVLHQLRDLQGFPKIPIYVDSPLCVNATEVFRLHPECYNQQIYEFLLTKRNPFGWNDITYIRELEHSMKLNDIREPVIIISASGMCEAGRILHHLRNSIDDERNTILFVGHCAENTLGSRILRGDNRVNIFGESHNVRAKIECINAFSGHADHKELLAYAQRVQGTKRKIVVVHGEPEYGRALKDALQKEHPSSEIILPVEGVPMDLS